jgi:transcriptional regulator with XRE-family HTH domain
LLDELSDYYEKDIFSVMRNLGEHLKTARNRLGLTLREVQRKTGLSNPYLSQLENGRIKRPSPSALHKLSECYRLPYDRLLRLAGHPAPDPVSEPRPSSRIGTALTELTEEEEKKLAEYLEFLRSREP